MTEANNTTGFELEDKVFVVLEGKKYFGTVKKVDPRLDRTSEGDWLIWYGNKNRKYFKL